MSIDVIVEAAAWIITIIMLILFVPRNRLREAQVVFLFKQVMTWLFGLTVVELGLIEYPVRLFANATRTSFTFEFFIYPAICVIFILHFPEKRNNFHKLLYYAAFCSVMTFIEVLVVEYTDLGLYLHWTWYLTWITLFITFYFSRVYYLWFFQKRSQ